MARFIRVTDTLGETRLLNVNYIVMVDPPNEAAHRRSSRIWLGEAMGDVWIDTKVPFDALAAFLNEADS